MVFSPLFLTIISINDSVRNIEAMPQGQSKVLGA